MTARLRSRAVVDPGSDQQPEADHPVGSLLAAY
jgi:hypothetical protein